MSQRGEKLKQQINDSCNELGIEVLGGVWGEPMTIPEGYMKVEIPVDKIDVGDIIEQNADTLFEQEVLTT